jgi:putative inorganic carbon (HCO3(-)) transporter
VSAGRRGRSFLRAFAWIEVLALVLVAPFALFPSPDRFIVLLAVPGLWFSRWLVTRRTRPGREGLQAAHFISRTPLDAALALLALMVLVSLYATYDINVSLPKIAGMVFGLAAFYVAVEAASADRRRLAWSVAVYLALGVGLAGLALLGTRWPGKFAPLQALADRLPVAIRGLPGAEAGFQGNEVGGSLLWFIPLAVSLWLASLASLFRSRRTPPGQREAEVPSRAIAFSLALAVLLITFALVQSRSAAAGLGFGLILMLAGLGRWGLGAAAILVAAVGGVVWQLGLGRVAEVIFGGVGELGIDPNLAGRLELWSRAIYGIQDFPFTGMGMNTFRHILQSVYPTLLIPASLDIGHAHNHLLQVALDLGIPGLVAYLAVWVSAAVMLAYAWRRAADPWLRAVALGLAGSLASYFVYGLTDTVALGAKPGLAFWLLLALCVAVWKLAGSHGNGPAEIRASSLQEV